MRTITLLGSTMDGNELIHFLYKMYDLYFINVGKYPNRLAMNPIYRQVILDEILGYNSQCTIDSNGNIKLWNMDIVFRSDVSIDSTYCYSDYKI